MTPQDVIRRAEESRDHPFLIVPDRRLALSYGEFHEAALGLACRLQEEGLGRGDRLVALLPNSPEYAILFFAALYMGATVATANPALSPAVISRVIRGSRGKLLVYAEETKRFLLGANKPADPIPAWLLPRLNEPLFNIPWRNPPYAPLEGVSGQDLWTIVFTSGTTAFPKAVAHTIANLLGNATAFNREMGIGRDNRFLHLLPMATSAGFFNVLISPFLAGASVVLTPGFGPRTALEFWRLPSENGVDTLWLTPSIAGALLKVDRDAAGKAWCRRSIRRIFIGTAPLAPKVKRDFEADYGVPLWESYGLSETLLVSGNGPTTGAVEGAVGRVLPGISAAIRDDQGRDVAAGTEGEIFIKTPHMMAGYLDDATGQAARPDDEWFPSGDLGTLAADGLLRITGRKKDLIIRGSLNISPAALENVLLQHEAVAQAAVVGVPDAVAGEEVVAVLKLKAGRVWIQERAGLEAYCRNSFPAPNRPTRLLEIDDFPSGPTGKVLKREIRAWAVKALAAEVQP